MDVQVTYRGRCLARVTSKQIPSFQDIVSSVSEAVRVAILEGLDADQVCIFLVEAISRSAMAALRVFRKTHGSEILCLPFNTLVYITMCNGKRPLLRLFLGRVI